MLVCEVGTLVGFYLDLFVWIQILIWKFKFELNRN
jgi:hypothetical protein